jgi:hypothetical protein
MQQVCRNITTTIQFGNVVLATFRSEKDRRRRAGLVASQRGIACLVRRSSGRITRAAARDEFVAKLGGRAAADCLVRRRDFKAFPLRVDAPVPRRYHPPSLTLRSCGRIRASASVRIRNYWSARLVPTMERHHSIRRGVGRSRSVKTVVIALAKTPDTWGFV